MKTEEKINILREMTLEQFLIFVNKPVAFTITEIDVVKRSIRIKYIDEFSGGYAKRSMDRDFKLDSYIEENVGLFKLKGLLYQMLNLVVSESDEISELSETRSYSQDFIENGLIASSFLYCGYLEQIGK